VTAPAVYPTGKQTIGGAVETIPGQAAAASWWMPVTKFEWNDKPTWLKDMAGRGVMGNDAFAIIQGVEIGELTIEGPAYCDTLGYWLGNLMGDVTATGTATTPTGLVGTGGSAVGATTIPSSVSIPSGTLIQIDTGNLAEIVTTSGAPTGAGPYTIPVPALAKPHAAGVAITAIQTTGIQHAFSLMNSGAGRGMAANSVQPSTLTITQYYGPAATSGGRQFVNVVFSEISFKWNAESELLTYTAKATAWVSAIPASVPAATYTSSLPIASWRGVLGLAGPATGGTQVVTAETGEYTLKRAVKPMFTAQGLQNPYIIARGGFAADWKNSFVAADESPYTYMRNNTQPQHQFVLTNGLTGANLLGIQFDMQQAAFTEAKANQGKEVVGWDCTGSAVFNTTNAGYTGGLSPIKVTLTNSVTPGSYV
jgi:hypothetical protein